MLEMPLRVLGVVGSLNQNANTRLVLAEVIERMKDAGCAVDMLDFLKEPLAMFNPDTAHGQPGFAELKARVEEADVLVLATPDYHGSISSVMKTFLDHFWHEFAGKLFVTIVASYEKGLTVTDQLRTVARQCYAWTMPYGVSFAEGDDVKDGVIVSESFEKRIAMTVRDAVVYGKLLGEQRRRDLAGAEAGFMARYRKGALT